jgi:hypothetical protein
LLARVHIASDDALGEGRGAQEGFGADTRTGQRLDGLGADVYASSHLPQRRGLLEDLYIKAELVERNSGGQPGIPPADNRNLQRHSATPLVAVSSCTVLFFV